MENQHRDNRQVRISGQARAKVEFVLFVVLACSLSCSKCIQEAGINITSNLPRIEADPESEKVACALQKRLTASLDGSVSLLVEYDRTEDGSGAGTGDEGAPAPGDVGGDAVPAPGDEEVIVPGDVDEECCQPDDPCEYEDDGECQCPDQEWDEKDCGLIDGDGIPRPDGDISPWPDGDIAPGPDGDRGWAPDPLPRPDGVCWCGNDFVCRCSDQTRDRADQATRIKRRPMAASSNAVCPPDPLACGSPGGGVWGEVYILDEIELGWFAGDPSWATGGPATRLCFESPFVMDGKTENLLPFGLDPNWYEEIAAFVLSLDGVEGYGRLPINACGVISLPGTEVLCDDQTGFEFTISAYGALFDFRRKTGERVSFELLVKCK